VKNNVVFRPTVVLGLGGTGHNTLLKLKRRFVDAYGSVPPIIRFLSIDTTENAEASTRAEESSPDGRLDHNETYVLQVGNPANLVNGTNPHIDEWWPPEIPTQAIIAGAGQVRARGRLALFAKAAEVYARIRRAVDDVRNIRNQKQMYADEFQVSDRSGVEVHLVGSLAGGTGSGTFLDVAFMARDVIGSDEQSNFTAVLLLPGIFTRHERRGSRQAERVRRSQRDRASLDVVIDVHGRLWLPPRRRLAAAVRRGLSHRQRERAGPRGHRAERSADTHCRRDVRADRIAARHRCRECGRQHQDADRHAAAREGTLAAVLQFRRGLADDAQLRRAAVRGREAPRARRSAERCGA
jgi:hypothetical protein